MPKNLSEVFRDWRFRTFLPVLVIHCIAFAGFYVFTYQFTMREMSRSFEFGTRLRLQRIDEMFTTSLPNHEIPKVLELIRSLVARDTPVDIVVLDSAFRSVVPASPEMVAECGAVMSSLLKAGKTDEVRTDREDGHLRVIGVRLVLNAPACHACHGDRRAVLGGIAVHRDLTPYEAHTSARLRQQLSWAALVWTLLALGLFWFRNVVIGRPLARIAQTVGELTPSPLPPGGGPDLDDLAVSVESTIGGLLDRQRSERTSIARGMERAEQLAALGQVAAGLSHEVKNPLAGIRAALEVFRREDARTGSEREPIYRQMLSELERVHRTLDGLLRLARPAAPARFPADLAKLVEKTVLLLSPQIEARQAKLVLRMSSELPPLELDGDQIIQVLLNLLSNAAQAVSAGGTVTLSVAPTPAGDGVLVSVADDGPGIAPEALERVFEPFFTTKAKGTGLGLPTSLRIVEQHGGTISVESEPGQGARFSVFLPVPPAPVPREGKA